MTHKKLLRGLVGITAMSIVLGACSKNGGTQSVDTTTTEQVTPATTPEPSSSPESNALPQATPQAQQQDQNGITASDNTQIDASQKGPQLSKKDDADSLNSDLNNTTIDTETFN